MWKCNWNGKDTMVIDEVKKMMVIFTLLGKYTVCEMHTFSGRIDCRLETADYIYLFEFKRDDTAENALKQIGDKEYSLPFTADRRKLYNIGVSFDSKTRGLSVWKESVLF